tara:strand:+ start:1277 stop:2050 length:774 start_codon:yes stop_codon:yes gene_type:complete
MKFSKKKFFKQNSQHSFRKFSFYISPLLKDFKFTHGFLTKESSDIDIENLAFSLKKGDNKNYFLHQIHSNLIVFPFDLNKNEKVKADGILSDKLNQNLWVYSADCMPILFADKSSRRVGIIHCGRVGLEKKIIPNFLKTITKLGSRREDLLVAIGPSISGEKYSLDKETFKNFLQEYHSQDLRDFIPENKINTIKNNYDKEFNPLDIQGYAFDQLIKEKILESNIDISNICTYENHLEFYSWRRNKTQKRQWSFISS